MSDGRVVRKESSGKVEELAMDWFQVLHSWNLSEGTDQNDKNSLSLAGLFHG